MTFSIISKINEHIIYNYVNLVKVMDDPSEFSKIIDNLQKNPHSKGYKCHTKLIRKLQQNGIWTIMSKVKLTIEELRAFCETYNVANNTVRTWN